MSSQKRNGLQDITGQLITAVIVIFIVGGWWLSNDGSLTECANDVKRWTHAIAEAGKDFLGGDNGDKKDKPTPKPSSTGPTKTGKAN